MGFLDSFKIKRDSEEYQDYSDNYDSAYDEYYNEEPFDQSFHDYPPMEEQSFGTKQEGFTVRPRSHRDPLHYATTESILDAENNFKQLPRGPVPAARRELKQQGFDYNDHGYTERNYVYDSPTTQNPYGATATTGEAQPRRNRLYKSGQVSDDITIIEPRSYGDVEQVTSNLKESRAVCLDLRSTRADLAKRILDFSFGIACGLNGCVDKVGDKIFIVEPHTQTVLPQHIQKLRDRGIPISSAL